MTATAFDTVKYTQRLERAGISIAQAEAFAEALKDASGKAEVATKRDVERLENKMSELKFESCLSGWLPKSVNLGSNFVSGVQPIQALAAWPRKAFSTRRRSGKRLKVSFILATNRIGMV